MDILFHYLRKALLAAVAAHFFLLVYSVARPEAGSPLGASLFAAFGAFAATCLSVALVKIIICTVRQAWLVSLQPYLRRRFETPPPPFNWMQ